MAAQLFVICVSVVIAGWLWFYVVRPILEDFGVIKGEETVKPSHVVMSRTPASRPLDKPAEPEPPHSPHMNDAEPTRTGGSGSAELALNADEVEAVARMIRHNATAAKPSKSSTIQAGFGVSRGGSSAYVRASSIYDALFGQPEPAVTPIAGRRTNARFSHTPHGGG